MGYMRHHAIVVTSFNDTEINKAHEKAKYYFGNLVSEIIESSINGYYSFFISPDGSKEDWDESEYGDKQRSLFKRWLISQLYDDTSSPYDWVEVQYGDGDHGVKVIDTDINYYKPEKNC